MSEVSIRLAEARDAGTIVRLVRELAAYERLLDRVEITEADVLRDGFGERPVFGCLLAEADDEPVGFALFYWSYSTFQGRPGIFLEDLFVEDAARGRGIGEALMVRLAGVALERGGGRLELRALTWNPARTFYERIGMAELDGWLSYRLEGEALRSLAGH